MDASNLALLFGEDERASTVIAVDERAAADARRRAKRADTAAGAREPISDRVAHLTDVLEAAGVEAVSVRCTPGRFGGGLFRSAASFATWLAEREDALRYGG